MRLVQRNGTVSTRYNKPLFDELGYDAVEKGSFNGTNSIGNGKYIGEEFMTKNGSEQIGTNHYFTFDSNDYAKWGITQDAPYYNTYNFHIGGSPIIGRTATRADYVRMSRTADSLPKGSYVTDYPYPTTGQAGMNIAAPHYKISLERGVPA